MYVVQPLSHAINHVQIRAEVREQVALLHAKIDAATRLHGDAQNTLNHLSADYAAATKDQQQTSAASAKMLQSFVRDFEARLGTWLRKLTDWYSTPKSSVEMLETRVASNHSLQSMNEVCPNPDLMRLKLSDKDTHVHENDQRHHEVAAQISAADLRVASLGRAQDVVADQLRQAQAKWNAQHNDHDHRIAQVRSSRLYYIY
ncbi:hypothetical protein AaE_007979 [Aphanomyces astaci]|uniref:Uncharacterized protein n=1 Tax=Aphanomyces astaci TaxID=112090 RepID=A0A6A5A148_APHAT|nr:hypothetical protein AaE_007979 [Aphanomyces astaci]